MIHGHPVKYRAETWPKPAKKFPELINHGAAVLTVRIHLPPAASRVRTRGAYHHGWELFSSRCAMKDYKSCQHHQRPSSAGWQRATLILSICCRLPSASLGQGSRSSLLRSSNKSHDTSIESRNTLPKRGSSSIAEQNLLLSPFLPLGMAHESIFDIAKRSLFGATSC
jgi:hypothetical protein